MAVRTATAVLLVGFQNEVFGAGGALREVAEEPDSFTLALENTLNLLRALQSVDALVVSAPLTFSDDYEELVEPVGLLAVLRQRRLLRAGTPGAAPVAALAEFGGRVVEIPGRGLDVFAGSVLHEVLQRAGVRDVAVAGALTSLGVAATARSAVDLGYRVSILSDCTATRSEFEQSLFCETIFPAYATVIDSATLLQTLASGPGSAEVAAGPGGRELDVQVQYRLVQALAEHERRLVGLRQGRDARVGLAVDPLTGLASRQTLESQGAAALARAARHGWATAVLVIDLDRFHLVNDRFGHHEGDAVLVEMGRRLANAFRPYDSVARASTVSRFAADEFVVVCEGVGEVGHAARLVERVQRMFQRPVTLDGVDVTVTASVGVAVAEAGDTDFDRLLLAAEMSMRAAKRRGGATSEVVAGGTPAAERVGEADLRRAIDGGELRLLYQPKIVLADDRLVGVEALVRWQHPVHGILSPAEFIELAERTHLIVPMGAWVIHEACRQTADWLIAAPAGGFTTSVNVSARQFTPGLVDTVAGALAASGLPPGALCLEVTESILIDDIRAGLAILGDLSALGVQLSIDDFGTGYSSLSYLKQLPVDELKIDQSFIAGLGEDPNDTAIVAAIVAMAHALDVSVVAEGVETPQQLERLRTLGCEQAQGFLFAQPQPPESITGLLTTTGPRSWGAVPGAAGSGTHRPTRVLVVDDNSEVRQLARMSLAAIGLEVGEASNGAEAMRIAAATVPDCVLLDLQMPGMTGLELCRRLRQQPSTAASTILMLTAHDDADGKIEAFASGADDYIVKPFSPRDLASRVQAALRRRAQPAAGTP